MTRETPHDPHLSPADIAGLTLTYGDRVAMLGQMADALHRDGVRRILVLANGLAPDPLARLHALAAANGARGLRLDIIESAVNAGSAVGFGQLLAALRDDPGIRAAWFMDDDNTPCPGALDALLAAQAAHPGATLSAVRRDRMYLMRAAATGIAPDPPAGVAFSMDLFRRPRALWQRITGRRARPAATPPASVPIARVPYGGLLVPRTLLDRVAPPRADFVLYADDYEYTERLRAAGGLFLVGAAEIEDLEASWNATGAASAGAPRSQLVRLATMPPDFRLYYALRNALYLDRKRARGAAMGVFAINLAALVAAGCLQALLRGRPDNARAIVRAARDGVTGRLGVATDFPLPQSTTGTP